MELQRETIASQKEKMIPVQLANGGYDFNQELIPPVRLCSFEPDNSENLKAFLQEQFSAVFTPFD